MNTVNAGPEACKVTVSEQVVRMSLIIDIQPFLIMKEKSWLEYHSHWYGMITGIVIWIMVLKILWVSIANSQTKKELFEKDYYLWIQHGCRILTQTQGFQPVQILNSTYVFMYCLCSLGRSWNAADH